jgi:hypothetical protein
MKATDITPPPTDEVAALIAAHASRFPEKHTLSVIGDGGKMVRLPILIANPLGAREIPKDKKTPGVWSQIVASAMRLRTEPPNVADTLARECLLWPPAALWSQWSQRWPGLPKAVADVLTQKVGAAAISIDAPSDEEEAPVALTEALELFPRGCWRKTRPGDEILALAIVPPEAPVWRLFTEALNKPQADVWRMCWELASACTVAAADSASGNARAPAEVFTRWPGLVPLVIAEISALIGASVEVEAGGW